MSKLSEMDVLIHRLLDVEADLNSSSDHTHHTLSLSILLTQLTQVSKQNNIMLFSLHELWYKFVKFP